MLQQTSQPALLESDIIIGKRPLFYHPDGAMVLPTSLPRRGSLSLGIAYAGTPVARAQHARALVNVAAVAGGTRFGPIRWPRSVTLVTSRATG